MKIKYFYPLLFLLLLFSQFKVSAQQEVTRQIELKLTDAATKTSHTYRINSANYLISNPLTAVQNASASEGSCSINLDLAQDVDPFMLKWISGQMQDVSGVITMVTIDGSKKPRNIAFTGSKIIGSSESFVSTYTDNSAQISFYVKTLSVDDTPVFEIAKN